MQSLALVLRNEITFFVLMVVLRLALKLLQSLFRCWCTIEITAFAVSDSFIMRRFHPNHPENLNFLLYEQNRCAMRVEMSLPELYRKIYDNCVSRLHMCAVCVSVRTCVYVLCFRVVL